VVDINLERCSTAPYAPLQVAQATYTAHAVHASSTFILRAMALSTRGLEDLRAAPGCSSRRDVIVQAFR
jgi:hypothetical protein